MKSIIIQTKGDRIPATLRLICTQGFGVSKEAEIRLIETIYRLQGNTSFMLNEGVRGQIIAQIGGITDGALKVNVSRLIKSGAIVKSGRLIGLHSIFKDVGVCEQIVIRIV